MTILNDSLEWQRFFWKNPSRPISGERFFFLGEFRFFDPSFWLAAFVSSLHWLWFSTFHLLCYRLKNPATLTVRSCFNGWRISGSPSAISVPDPIKDILNTLGYDCTLTFGLAFSSTQMLDQNIQKLLPVGDDTTSPLRARLRALSSRCNSIHTSPPIPAAQTFPPTPAASPVPSPLNSSSNWHETLPPKISSDDVTSMKQLFEKNYPGEVLDPYSTPSIRFWSWVHQQKINKVIKYIPIQLRLSEHQTQPWSKPDHPNRFEVKSNFFHNFAGTTLQRWTSHQSAFPAIGSTEPQPCYGTHMFFVECATYKSSKPLTQRSLNIPLSNLTKN